MDRKPLSQAAAQNRSDPAGFAMYLINFNSTPPLTILISSAGIPLYRVLADGSYNE